ncbi:MAG: GAF protein, partial [Anaerolineales bacterium]|nr:GAF protein [Anaerolineales bacterium]
SQAGGQILRLAQELRITHGALFDPQGRGRGMAAAQSRLKRKAFQANAIALVQPGAGMQIEIVLWQEQVAVALQNTRSYAQAQRQADREALINTIGQKIQNAATVDDAIQVAIRELGRTLGAQRTSVRLNVAAKSRNGQESPEDSVQDIRR